jgi:RNA polymerase sigma factor (sigma-70 family)
MMQEETWSELVRQAQKGRKEGMGGLALEAKGRLCAYIYRVTLDYDLTQDLSQEVLLQMVKSLNGLKDAERFWPWLYRIAQSKIQQYYKTKYKKISAFDADFYKEFCSKHAAYQLDGGLSQLLQKELSKKVLLAMRQIKQQYRAILSLRCFEELPYSDIAMAMECSEVRARVLFFRAKQALLKQLSHQGLSKSVLLTGLGVFGSLTAPAEASSSAVTVSAASTKVGMTTAMLATAGSKAGITAVVVAGLISIGAMSLWPERPAAQSEPSLPQRAEVKSLHFITQLQNSSLGNVSSLSKGAYEQWFFFPDGIDGPMFMRMQRWTAEQDRKLCAWLQDGQANYYFNCDYNKVHINNCRVCWSCLRVRRLPTDPAEFTDFLSKVEGDWPGLHESTRDEETGLMTTYMDFRFANAPNFQTDYGYNTVGPEQFRFGWSDFPIVDERDRMHKRGWTYFRIDGQVNDKIISGKGRIPFVYESYKKFPAWMILKIGDELEIIDCSDGAYLRRADGTLTTAYPAGAFFKGLGRPWMGLHTLDIVRRDAIEERVWFETEPTANQEKIIVIFDCEDKNTKTNMIYSVDMETDILEYIRYEEKGETIGTLRFSYLQDIEQAGDEFIEPAIPKAQQVTAQEGPGMLWLVYLAEGKLGK